MISITAKRRLACYYSFMGTARVTAALRALNAWHLVRRLLRVHGILTSPLRGGWDELDRKLQEIWTSSLESLLIDLYADLCIHGRKSLRIFRPPNLYRKRLLETPLVSGNLQNPSLEVLLHPSESSDPQLVSVLDLPHERLFLFLSSRQVRREETVDPAEITLPERFTDGATKREIRVITYDSEPAVDVVAVSRQRNWLETRIHKSHERRMFPSADEAHAAVHTKLLDLSGTFNPGSPINLFPAMQSMYSTPSEGRIVRLDFRRHSSARTTHKFATDNILDFRTETYHQEGTKAIGGAIEVLGLMVQWDKDDQGQELQGARLNLPCPSRGALDKKKTSDVINLLTAEIPSIVGRLEYRFIIERLWSHVQRT